MRWHSIKEQAARLIAFIIREPWLFVQYVFLFALALGMFTLVMQYKIQKSIKKQEKIRKQKEKILRKLHGSRRKALDEHEAMLALEKEKDKDA
ncbi:unnamed protein product [Strongylus vulgaris]|uniref:Uncharacterized protein n=1 Tax=Strongylus vulgaris TaxID=40348 RepID=A0A3P7JJP1_STRVU|nr:unnamed protein product [Strongylus vulgaris]